MADIIRKQRGGNLYLDGSGYPSVVEEMTFPEVKALLEEHKTAALGAKLDLPHGLDKMTTTFKADCEPALIAASVDFVHTHLLQYRGNLESEDASGRYMEQSVVAHLRVRFTGNKPDGVKGEESTKYEISASVEAYKLEIDGVPLFDIDVRLRKHEVLGKNLNATRNSNLGLD